MEAFTQLTAIGVPLDERNIDTNQLCPTRFNKMAEDDPDYHRVLFNNQRFLADGSANPEFILNQPPYDHARIIVADDNFGCGSSRESAVYALLAFGIRCVIAPGFGDIFHANATKNGLLPVTLDGERCDAMRLMLRERPGAEITVSLEDLTVVAPDGSQHAFSIHATTRRAMLAGLDDVGITQQYADTIAAFEQRHFQSLPWVYER